MEKGTGKISGVVREPTRVVGTSPINPFTEGNHGPDTNFEGFLHWQVIVKFRRKLRLGGVRTIFGPVHAEPTRSPAALEYVWKDKTAISGTRFELGKRPVNRCKSTDWDAIREQARVGTLSPIPSDIFIRCYNQLRRIQSDYSRPVGVIKEVRCYWGITSSGKSHRAWAEAGTDAYSKDPRTKFWDGYRGEANVVIDEYRGSIDISHMLRWLDKYPVRLEVKGSSTVLNASNIWLTSNLHPRDWYPELDPDTTAALLRRMTITEFKFQYNMADTITEIAE